MLTIATALPWEASYFAKRLSHPTRIPLGDGWAVEGFRGTTSVRLVVSGPGRKSVEAVTAQLDRIRPLTSAVLSTGVAGGLTDTLTSGTLILDNSADKTADPPSQNKSLFDKNSRKHIEALLQQKRIAFQKGGVLTVDKPLVNPREKHEAFVSSGALIAQMEDTAWQEWANVVRIPFITLRVVLDEANNELPPEVLTWNWRGPTWLQIMRSVGHRPHLGIELIRLARQRSQARRAIDQALEIVIASLSTRKQ